MLARAVRNFLKVCFVIKCLIAKHIVSSHLRHFKAACNLLGHYTVEGSMPLDALDAACGSAVGEIVEGD